MQRPETPEMSAETSADSHASHGMTVRIPNILADALGTRSIDVNGTTVRDVLAELRTHPTLGPLIFDESKALRRHVLVFVNDVAVQHLPSLDTPLNPTDQIAVVQNVSGG
jgi:sulfur-carrier protein